MISSSIFGEEAKAAPTPEAGLLSREATAAVGSAYGDSEEARADTKGCCARHQDVAG
jgi:hypothetical protein